MLFEVSYSNLGCKTLMERAEKKFYEHYVFVVDETTSKLCFRLLQNVNFALFLVTMHY